MMFYFAIFKRAKDNRASLQLQVNFLKCSELDANIPCLST